MRLLENLEDACGTSQGSLSASWKLLQQVISKKAPKAQTLKPLFEFSVMPWLHLESIIEVLEFKKSAFNHV